VMPTIKETMSRILRTLIALILLGVERTFILPQNFYRTATVDWSHPAHELMVKLLKAA